MYRVTFSLETKEYIVSVGH